MPKGLCLALPSLPTFSTWNTCDACWPLRHAFVAISPTNYNPNPVNTQTVRQSLQWTHAGRLVRPHVTIMHQFQPHLVLPMADRHPMLAATFLFTFSLVTGFWERRGAGAAFESVPAARPVPTARKLTYLAPTASSRHKRRVVNPVQVLCSRYRKASAAGASGWARDACNGRGSA